MRWSLSIGLRWTLRFTLAMLVVVGIFAALLYSQVRARTERDARAFLALQVQKLAEVAEREGVGAEAVRGTLEDSVAVAEADFKLGLRVYDGDRQLLLSGGSLERHPVPLPAELPEPTSDRAVAEQEWLFEDLDVGENYPYLLQTLPVDGGVLQGLLYTRRFVRGARDVRNLSLYTAPAMLLLASAIAYWLTRGSLRPIQEITASARRISGTHLEETIPTSGSRDELDELASTLNEMMDRIREGMTRTRRFAANAAHELRTPLNRMRSRLEVTLEKDRDPDEYRDMLAEIMGDLEGLSEAVHGLMRLARSEAGLAPEQRVEVDLGPLLAEVVSFFEPLAEEKGVALTVGEIASIQVPGDPSWLHQAFANLVHNAIKYTPPGGRVDVTLRLEGDDACAQIRDTGPGIEPAEAERIFEPFHRLGATPDTPGVGLGLPLARELVRAHGGELRLRSRSTGGSDFSVRLPTRPA